MNWKEEDLEGSIQQLVNNDRFRVCDATHSAARKMLEAGKSPDAILAQLHCPPAYDPNDPP